MINGNVISGTGSGLGAIASVTITHGTVSVGNTFIRLHGASVNAGGAAGYGLAIGAGLLGSRTATSFTHLNSIGTNFSFYYEVIG